MKRTYQTPEAKILANDLQLMLRASDGVTSDRDIDYGGIDANGEKDPESRGLYERYDVWGDMNDASSW